MRKLNQKGLSMVEILIATLVMFLALSILMTVMGVAGTIAYNARVMDRATFLANQQIEYIRSLPFDRIGYRDAQTGFPNYEPSGILPRQETTIVAGIQFQVTYLISWVDDPKDGQRDGQNADDPQDEDYYNNSLAHFNWQDYKKVRVEVSWQRPRPSSYAVVTNIAGIKEFAVPPLVYFTTDTLPNNSIVSGPTVTIGVIGMQNTTAGAPISNIGLEIGGGILVFNELVSPPQPQATAYFIWDTTTATPDGLYEVRGIARDSQGLEASISYFYIVNNHPPEGSPSLVSIETTDSSARIVKITFTTIKDGRDWVSQYQAWAQAGLGNSFTTITVPNPQEGTVTVFLSGLSPWTTYTYSLRGYSYGDYSNWGNSLNITTLMELSWQVVKIKADPAVVLTWQNGPDFSGAYYLYRRQPQQANWEFVTSTIPPTANCTDTAGVLKWDTQWQYKVEARDRNGNLVNYSPVIQVVIPRPGSL